MIEGIVFIALVALLTSFVVLLLGNFRSRTYVFVLMVAALWLIMYPQLRSPYVLGIDSHWERIIANDTLSSGHWNPAEVGNIVNGALSIALFEPLISLISGLPIDYVSKFVFSGYTVLGVPIMWRSAKRLLGLNDKQSFVAVLVVIGTASFMLSSAYSREEVATFAMLVALYFVLPVSRLIKGGLAAEIAVIMLTCAIVVSHYATALIYVSVLILATLTIRLKSKRREAFRSAVLSAVMMVAWIVYLATLLEHTVSGFSGVFTAMAGFATDRVSTVVQDQLNPTSQGPFQLANFLVNLGILTPLLAYVVFDAKEQAVRPTSEQRQRYAILSFFLALLFVISFLPGASLIYNPERLFLKVLQISGGYSFLGIQRLTSVVAAIRKKTQQSGPTSTRMFKGVALVVASSLVLVHFAFQVGLPSEILLGRSSTKFFDPIQEDIHYTLKDEISAIGWLVQWMPSSSVLYTDSYGRGYLPLESYGMIRSSNVSIIHAANEIPFGANCYLFYQQNAALTFENPAFAARHQSIAEIQAALTEEDKVYDAGDAVVYALCGSLSS